MAAVLAVVSVGLAGSGPAPVRAHRALLTPERAEGPEGDPLAWLDKVHRAPPGVDWRAVEGENRRLAIALRAALVETGGAAAAPPRWTERGASDQAGRTQITALAADGRSLLIGTAGGGIFSGTPGVRAWRPRADNLGISIYHFLIAPGRPEVWLAASEYGQVFVSRNQGASWSVPAGLPWVLQIHRMLHDPAQPRVVYLLISSTDEGSQFDTRLCRSLDGGLSFTVVYRTDGSTAPDLWTNPAVSGPLYLMVRGQLLVSSDRGETFSALGTAGDGHSAPVVLRRSAAGDAPFYAAVAASDGSWQLFASEDGGRTWDARAVIPRDDYFSGRAFAVSQRDPELVLYGGVNAHRSTDGGRTFALVNDWVEYYGDPRTKLHADIDGIDVFPWHGKETVFIDTDGGTWMSLDGGATLANIALSGLDNAMYYGSLTSARDPNLIAVGSQDQGLQLSRPRKTALLGFDQLVGADYSHLTSANDDLRMLWFVYPSIVGLLPDPADRSRLESYELPSQQHGFFAALVADPDDPASVYIGADHIWRLRRTAEWEASEDQAPQDFSAGGTDFVAALAIAPGDHDRWYAATYLGWLWTSRDHGATWTRSPSSPHDQYFASSSLLVSPSDPNTCFVAGSGYGNGGVYRTTDGGATWSPLTAGLPHTEVWALAFDSPATQTLYAATDAGPFRYTPAGGWVSLLGGVAPITQYLGVEGVPAAKLLRFATFGRGIWDYTPPAARPRR